MKNINIQDLSRKIPIFPPTGAVLFLVPNCLLIYLSLVMFRWLTMHWVLKTFGNDSACPPNQEAGNKSLKKVGV